MRITRQQLLELDSEVIGELSNVLPVHYENAMMLLMADLYSLDGGRTLETEVEIPEDVIPAHLIEILR